jgi:hypothetical protein
VTSGPDSDDPTSGGSLSTANTNSKVSAFDYSETRVGFL